MQAGEGGCGGDHQAAAELLAEGIARSDGGHFSEALTSYAEALRLIGSPLGAAAPDCSAEHDQLRARILLSMAFPTHELGDTAAGLDLLARAEQLADRGGLGELTVLSRAQRGVMLLREGRLTEAISQLDRAVELIDEAAPEDQCKLMLNRGQAHEHSGHLTQAMADFTRGFALAVRFGLDDLAFAAQHNLGCAHALSGDLPRALEVMPTVDQAGSDHFKGVVGMDRARVLLSAGLVTDADQTLAEAIDALGRTQLTTLHAEAELTRAEAVLLAERTDQARALAGHALELLRPRDNARATALAELTMLKVDAATDPRRPDLGDRAATIGDDLKVRGMPDPARAAQLIGLEARLAQGDPVDAAELRLTRSMPVDLRLRTRWLRSRVALQDGQSGRAAREARTGLGELAEYQSQFGSLDLQAASADHGNALAGLMVTEEIRRGRATAVLGWLERARAISGRVPEVQPPEDPVSADLLGQLRWVVNELDQGEADADRTEQLRRRRTELQASIRARSWTVRGSRAVTPVPTVGRLREQLRDAAVVAVFRLADSLYAVVLTQRHCRLERIGPVEPVDGLAAQLAADLDALAMERIPDVLRTAVTGSLRSRLRALDDALIRPLRLPAGPVVLLPPGRFAALSWGALPSLRGRPLTLATSAAAWLASAEAAVRPTTRVVVAAGPGLERASDEAAEVAAYWPDCRRLFGIDATASAMLAAVDGSDLVHVAAHGQHQPDSPLFSSIRLHDGPLSGYDLDRVPRPPRQVVLSACDLGRSTVRRGDEALGLTRALLHSGTRTVISSVAKVNDHRAADLMRDYHARLASGAAPAYALAEALEAADEPLPFACFGAGW